MQAIGIFPRIVYKAWFAAILLFSVLIVAGCSNSSNSSSTLGTLGVSLTDAPACGFDAVNVTVSKVRVHQSASATENDAGWSDIILSPARKINLLDLTNGALEDLGQTPLPAGHYTQLRLVLDANNGSSVSNSIVLLGTTAEIALITPSAVQSGIKLINEFDVAPGQRVDLVLDFDACKSVVTLGNGNYLLKPVIKVIPTVLNGIDGFVDTSLLIYNVAVSAQSNGAVVRSTVPDSKGEFFLARLDAPANYDVVLTADDHATAVITGVPVLSTTSTTTVSTSAAPITLPTSTMGSISGTITLNPTNLDVIAFAAALQTFPAGPTVTVKSQAVDSLGAYSLTLPVAAPLIVSYGTATFTPEPSIAGIYTVEASAISYLTSSAIVSVPTQSLNFTLIP